MDLLDSSDTVPVWLKPIWTKTYWLKSNMVATIDWHLGVWPTFFFFFFDLDFCTITSPLCLISLFPTYLTILLAELFLCVQVNFPSETICIPHQCDVAIYHIPDSSCSAAPSSRNKYTFSDGHSGTQIVLAVWANSWPPALPPRNKLTLRVEMEMFWDSELTSSKTGCVQSHQSCDNTWRSMCGP